MTKALVSEIDRCHRRQLRSLIGIRFPNRISNINLYQRCREEPLSATIEKARMQMLGHALRLSPDTPAQQAMSGYFTPQQRGYKGRPRSSLVGTLNQDLLSRGKLGLSSRSHLDDLSKFAADRNGWRQII
ncbi:uncharacterized protein LOC135819082 [Sycon ciliatum]|uniref:uncharacterized protein LOC135819082 n=1 Tax=Sycon ciliatum TaxID=27933 RepID=UPI0031F6A946